MIDRKKIDTMLQMLASIVSNHKDLNDEEKAVILHKIQGPTDEEF